jgi:GNAT acetyltransferase-like protein
VKIPACAFDPDRQAENSWLNTSKILLLESGIKNQLLSSTLMQAKKEYIDFYEANDDIPLFMRPYWLDAVAGVQAWDAIISRNEEGRIVGAWAIHQRKLRGFKAIILPPMTPFTGIYMDVDTSLPVQKQSFLRQEILEDLIRQVPRVAIFGQKFQFHLRDWLPFYWKGYKQETRYTFRFENPDPEAIYANFSKSFKRNLRAGERKFKVETSTDVTELYRLVQRVFEIRKDAIPFDLNTLNNAYAQVHARHQSTIYRAVGEDGVNAAILTVWDDDTTYYLLGGRAGSSTKNSTQILLWHAIKDAAERGHHFDFEGSMIKGVNRFFQSFGPEMVEYHYVYRYRGVARVKQF